jgi:hypothetical protein
MKDVIYVVSVKFIQRICYSLDKHRVEAGLNTRDSRKIGFPSPPSAESGMDEMHTYVGGTGH